MPSPEDGASDGVRAAEEGVRAAQTGVTEAQKALNEAGAGPSAVETWQADVKVAAAQQALAKAQGGDGDVQQAQWDLQDRPARTGRAPQGQDTSAQRSALDSARAQVTSANQALEEARQKALPYLPGARCSTSLNSRAGWTRSASSADRCCRARPDRLGSDGASDGAAAEADAALLSVGAEGSFELPDGTAHRAVISELKAGKDNKARWEVLPRSRSAHARADHAAAGEERAGEARDRRDRRRRALRSSRRTHCRAGGESRVEVVESDPVKARMRRRGSSSSRQDSPRRALSR